MKIDEKIFRRSTIDRYNKKISTLGSNSNITTNNYLLSRLFIEILLLIICLFIPKYGLIVGIVLTILFHYLYEYLLLDQNIKIRNDLLYEESLIFFRMLKLSLKSLDIVTSKFRQNSFAMDFYYLLKKNNYNNDLNQVFKDMQLKVDNQDLKIALLDLSKTNDFDNTLDIIIDNLQNKSNLIIKQKYSKLPFRLTVLSLVFIVSFIIIIIFLPNILSFIY